MDGLYGHIVSVEIDLFYLKGKPIDDKTESGFTSVPHFSTKKYFLALPPKTAAWRCWFRRYHNVACLGAERKKKNEPYAKV